MNARVVVSPTKRTHLGRQPAPKANLEEPESEWISRHEAAERLGTSLSTLDRWRRQGAPGRRMIHRVQDGATVYDSVSVEEVRKAREEE